MAEQETTVKITRVGARGDGVMDAGDGPVFVPFTLPGEHVRISPDARGERWRLLEIIRQSPDRITPECPHFGACGGCALQHWRPEPVRTWKRALVVEALERAGVSAQVEPVLDAVGEGRRRATFHAVRAKSVGFVFGFAQRASHHVCDLGQCAVLTPSLRAQLEPLRAFAEHLSPRAGRVDCHVNLTQTGLDISARGGDRSLDAALLSEVSALADAHQWARVTVKGELVLQRAKPIVDVDGVSVTPPSGGFLQATAAGEQRLAEMVVKACAGADRVLDLFSGWGAFALRLARRCEVRAVEGDGEAVEALRTAARHGVGLKPITAHARDLAKNPLGYRELNWADVVVLDPPRAGAARQVLELTKSTVERVVSVSCNPSTFARDARTLIDGGFSLDVVCPVDQFEHSPHVEVVGVFTRSLGG